MSWAAVAGAAVGVVGGAISSRNASRAQSGSADAASQVQMDMYNQSREDQAGYRARGDAAGNRLAQLLGLNVAPVQTRETFDARAYLAANPDVAADPYFSQRPYEHFQTYGQGEGRTFTGTPQASVGGQQDPQFGSLLRNFTGADLQNEPGYQFRLTEGNRALDRSAAARGGLYSGAQLRGLTRYNQDFASNEFTNAFNRDQANRSNTFNMLSGISGTGQAATNQVGQQGMQVGQSVGNNLIGAGNARASGYLATGNALLNGVNQGLSAWGRRNNNGGTSYNSWLQGIGGDGSINGDQLYG